MRLWPFSKRRETPSHRLAWNLTDVLLQWSPDDPWTLGDGALQGVQCFGSTGSGKSSAVLRLLNAAYLSANFGGVYLCSKPDDAGFYLSGIRAAGREKDVILIGPEHPESRYNFIDSEFQRTDARAGVVEGLAPLLASLTELAQHRGGSGGGGGKHSGEGGQFWENSRNEGIRNGVELLARSGRSVTIRAVMSVFGSAANSVEEVRSESWQRDSLVYQCLRAAAARATAPGEQADVEILSEYWLNRWPRLSDRTRSVIASDICSTLDPLQRGILRDIFSTDTTVRPEMAQEGSLIIVDAPPMGFPEVGRYISAIFKHCYQRVQARRINPQRPCFLIADESHLHATPDDAVFATIARSTRTAIVYLTQSIASYLTAFGGAGGEHADASVATLMGNLQTQVFLQQTDTRTIHYAQELIGKRRQLLFNAGNSSQCDNWAAYAAGLNGGTQTNTGGYAESYECDLQASDFNSLRKGGPPHWQVDGILYQGGRTFRSTGASWMPVTFPQQRPR